MFAGVPWGGREGGSKAGTDLGPGLGGVPCVSQCVGMSGASRQGMIPASRDAKKHKPAPTRHRSCLGDFCAGQHLSRTEH